MIVQTSWYDNRGAEDLANLDLDRFAIPLEDARKLDRIRTIMSERAGREIRIEELVKAALDQFLDSNSALLVPSAVAVPSPAPIKPAVDPLELVPVREWDPVARTIFLGMIP